MKGFSSSSYWRLLNQPLNSPVKSLVAVFLVWKIILLLVTFGSPSPGYDTSTLLALNGTHHSDSRHIQFGSYGLLERLAIKLLRWDAIYYTKLAERGYLHEQEWAFSWAFTRLLAFMGKGFSGLSIGALPSCLWAGIIICHLSHLLSVVLLYQFSIEIQGGRKVYRSIAFLAAVFHIISPAGLFLSAPYTESLFSLFSFSAALCYARSKTRLKDPTRFALSEDYYLLVSGVLFALATLMRGNGLFWGAIYLYDAVTIIIQFSFSRGTLRQFRTLVVTSTAGLAIFVGFVGPQWLAYREYCMATGSGDHLRPWCTRALPSIYSWVQSHYWNVGFLRYWTLSNAPLFLLAAPMLCLLSQTSLTLLDRQPLSLVRHAVWIRGYERASIEQINNETLAKLAIPQILLALLATTSFHIQIINRLSSGYPVWYYVIATWLADTFRGGQISKALPGRIVRGMVMYAIIQGALFSSFLPPA